jgi:UDPglucose 6-dehydrogenase
MGYKNYNWQEIYTDMLIPTFVFDGRNLLDEINITEIGFEYKDKEIE